MQKKPYVLLAVLGAVGAVLPAQAATIVYNNGAPYDEVVHANSAGSGTTLNTLTKPGSIPVTLTSADGLDVGNGDGVAIVKGLGTGTGDGFSALLIDPATGFGVMQFKIEDFANQRAQTLDIRVNFEGGAFQIFDDVALPANSKIDVLAGAGEVMDSILLYGLLDGAGAALRFQDVKQISFNAMQGGVPEPASWAMMLAGFGLVGASARKRTARTMVSA